MYITPELPEHLSSQAAVLYWKAFSSKLSLVLGDDGRGIDYFSRIIVPKQAIAAISNDGDMLLGLAGFDLGQGGVIGGGFRELWDVYGLSSLWRAPLLAFFTRQVNPDTLQMDGITVAPDFRGEGIGAALLEAIFVLAHEAKLRFVALDVIDTNPDAKRLYERMGFKHTKSQRIGLLRHIFGFSISHRMIKRIE